MITKIGLGGGCHWCTESVFLSLTGANKVEQGWIKSDGPYDTFSEAVIVHFDGRVISLASLIEIHLYTHSSTSLHSFRERYRSAVYTYTKQQHELVKDIIDRLSSSLNKKIITQVLPFTAFKQNEDRYLEYYAKHKGNAFCTRYIDPKKELLKVKWPKLYKEDST